MGKTFSKMKFNDDKSRLIYIGKKTTPKCKTDLMLDYSEDSSAKILDQGCPTEIEMQTIVCHFKFSSSHTKDKKKMGGIIFNNTVL